ncbi:MAG: hypothetical protein AAF919_00455 [Pseudomonadota bacterium]
MWSIWWIWMLGAVALAVLELLAPGYLFLGFAIGVGLVGLGLMTGILGALTNMAGAYGFAALLLLAAALSLGAWMALRAVFGAPGQAPQTFERDVNDD